MYQRIYQCLFRQSKALSLLRELLEEEYEVLRARDTGAVVALEFSIQELIRQLVVEKSVIIRGLNGVRLREYMGMLSEDEAAPLAELINTVDMDEQLASRQASQNAQFSLALLDQSSRILTALTSQAMPPRADTYGRRGGMKVQAHPQAALFSGRL